LRDRHIAFWNPENIQKFWSEKRRVQKRFGFDIIVVRENTLEYEEAVAFFQQVRGERPARKGILRLAL
jgi:hypothetical protein